MASKSYRLLADGCQSAAECQQTIQGRHDERRNDKTTNEQNTKITKNNETTNEETIKRFRPSVNIPQGANGT